MTKLHSFCIPCGLPTVAVSDADFLKDVCFYFKIKASFVGGIILDYRKTIGSLGITRVLSNGEVKPYSQSTLIKAVQSLVKRGWVRLVGNKKQHLEIISWRKAFQVGHYWKKGNPFSKKKFYRFDIDKIDCIHDVIAQYAIQENLQAQDHVLRSKLIVDEMINKGIINKAVDRDSMSKTERKMYKHTARNLDFELSKRNHNQRFVDRITTEFCERKHFEAKNKFNIYPEITLSRQGIAKVLNKRSRSTAYRRLKKYKNLGFIKKDEKRVYKTNLFCYDLQDIQLEPDSAIASNYFVFKNRIYVKTANKIELNTLALNMSYKEFVKSKKQKNVSTDTELILQDNESCLQFIDYEGVSFSDFMAFLDIENNELGLSKTNDISIINKEDCSMQVANNFNDDSLDDIQSKKAVKPYTISIPPPTMQSLKYREDNTKVVVMEYENSITTVSPEVQKILEESSKYLEAELAKRNLTAEQMLNRVHDEAPIYRFTGHKNIPLDKAFDYLELVKHANYIETEFSQYLPILYKCILLANELKPTDVIYSKHRNLKPKHDNFIKERYIEIRRIEIMDEIFEKHTGKSIYDVDRYSLETSIGYLNGVPFPSYDEATLIACTTDFTKLDEYNTFIEEMPSYTKSLYKELDKAYTEAKYEFDFVLKKTAKQSEHYSLFALYWERYIDTITSNTVEEINMKSQAYVNVVKEFKLLKEHILKIGDEEPVIQYIY